MTPTSPKSIAMQGIQGFTGSKSFKDAASFCRGGDFFGADPSFPPEKMAKEVLVVIGILGGVTGISTDTNNAFKNPITT